MKCQVICKWSSGDNINRQALLHAYNNALTLVKLLKYENYVKLIRLIHLGYYWIAEKVKIGRKIKKVMQICRRSIWNLLLLVLIWGKRLKPSRRPTKDALMFRRSPSGLSCIIFRGKWSDGVPRRVCSTDNLSTFNVAVRSSFSCKAAGETIEKMGKKLWK